MGKHPNPKEIVTVDLQPGSATYLAVTTTIMNYGAAVILVQKSHIEIATCQEFVEDRTRYKAEPVPVKKISEKVRVQVRQDSDLLQCAP